MDKGYSAPSKLLHWSMAFLLLSMLMLGFSMVKSLAIWQVEAVALHKSFGLIALILVVIRLINRYFSTAPPLPTDLPYLQLLAAKGTQILLYGAMILMPITGILMQHADGRGVSFFSLFTLPSFIEPNIRLYGFFREIHGVTATVFLLLIVLHVCGALYHGVIRQDGVLASMIKRNIK